MWKPALKYNLYFTPEVAQPQEARNPVPDAYVHPGKRGPWPAPPQWGYSVDGVAVAGDQPVARQQMGGSHA